MNTKMIVLAAGLAMLLSGGAYAQSPESQPAVPSQGAVKSDKKDIKKDKVELKKDIKQKRKDKKKKRGNK